MNVLYLCDQKACDHCSPECKHTADISHAKHFERGYDGETYVETVVPLFVFKANTLLKANVKQRIREELLKQAETGVIFCDGMLEPIAIDGDLYTISITKKEVSK